MFDKCKTNLKILDIEEKDLIWAVCYSFNANKATRFLENEWLSFLFMLATKFVPREKYSDAYNEVLKEFESIAMETVM